MHSKLDIKRFEVPAREDVLDTVWHPSRNMGEGGTLSALLSLNAKYVSDDRLLARPFPSKEDARYPSLYLADEFLDQNPLIAARNIRGHLDAIPPALIHQLADNMLKVLERTDPETSAYTTLREVAILVVVRLAESDRPALATQLVIRTIMDRPKSSAWHRQFLKPSFLRRLPAPDTRACMQKFAEEVIHMLRTKGGKEDREVPVDQPYIKVTTIKQLAQLLQETDLIGTDHALSMLSELSQTNMHADIRLDIVKGVLELLKVSSQEHLNYSLTLLETLISLAGALNEPEPLTESGWAEHERDLSLPEFEHDFDTESPVPAVRTAYFHHARSDVHNLQPYVDRIITPVLRQLKQQTSRWVALFLANTGSKTLPS
jgi:hypothetical protein